MTKNDIINEVVAELSADFDKDRFDKFKKFYQKNGWQSPYFMPKEAARIFLKVTDVRVEQLQHMSDIDARKEGIDRKNYPLGEFIDLWKSTIKKTEIDIYGRSANPWVWVIEFERCEKPSEVEINEL